MSAITHRLCPGFVEPKLRPRARRKTAAAAGRAASRRAPRRASARSPCRSVSTSARRTASRASRRSRSARSDSSTSRALGRLVAEQHGSAHRRGPRALFAAEQAGERLGDLAGAERLLGEERELPAVERLAEPAVVVGEQELRAQVGREPCRGSCRAGSPRRAAASPRSAGSARSAAAGSRAARRRRGRPRSRRRSRAGARSRRRRARRPRPAARLRPESSSRRSSSTSSRSTSRPNSGGIKPCASGQSCEISPEATGRSVMPPPRSTSVPAESPTTGASATYVRFVPKSVCSRSAYAASNASSFQSKPPQRSAVHVSIGSRIDRKSASSPVSPIPAWARAKIAAAGSRFRSSIALRASGSRRSVGACSSTKPRTSGRYS